MITKKLLLGLEGSSSRPRTILVDMVLLKKKKKKKKLGQFKSGECGAHLGSWRLLISWPGNLLSSHFTVMFVVCEVVPPC